MFFSSRLVFRGILIIKQEYDQCSDKVKSQRFKILPYEGEEGGFAKSSVWSIAAAEDWPVDFFFLRLVTLVIGNLRFPPMATSVRDGASWPIFGLSAGKA